VVEKVLSVASRRGVAPAQVALAWLLAQPGVTSPIVGITRPEHLTDAVAAVDLELTAQELDELGADYTSRGIAGHR
jgi:aryl-alcohol dehydrogenase (NADP+)